MIIKHRIFTPHDILKSSLSKNEDIWIYDEPNGVAVTVQEVNEKKYYTALAFLPSRCIWTVIDIQQTDPFNADLMYKCLVTAVKHCKGI